MRSKVLEAAQALRSSSAPSEECTQGSPDDHYLWADLSPDQLFLELLSGAAEAGSVFPLCSPPPPPKPASRSRRVRARFCKAWSLWKDVFRIINVFNDVINNPSGAEVTAAGWTSEISTDQQMTVDGPLGDSSIPMLEVDGLEVGLPGRFNFVAGVDSRTRLYWSNVATLAQRVRLGRRHSFSKSGTGGQLYSRLKKSLADCYGRTSTATLYRPFIASEIKENPRESPEVDALSYIGGSFRDTIMNKALMMRELTPDEQRSWDEPNRAYDIFGGSKKEWVRYLNLAVAEPLFHFAPAADCGACTGVVAVGRAKDTKLRKILAAIPFNLLMRKPEEVLDSLDTELGMLGPAALSCVSAGRDGISWCALDESQAFTSVAAPRWFWRYQCGPVVRAGDLRPEIRPSWATRDDELLRPQYKRLAMGNSWSVLILVVLHITVVRRTLLSSSNPQFQSFQVINEAMIRGMTSHLSARGGVVYIHVDDMIFGHSDLLIAIRAAKFVKRALENLGFIVDFTAEPEKVVGVAPVSQPPALMPPLTRVGDLDRALEMIEQQLWLHPPLVATVLGIWVWFSLLWRPSLSMATAIFKWVELFRTSDMAPVWNSVRRDFQRMRAVLPFMKADLALPVVPLLFCQDAAGGSLGTIQGKFGSFALSVGAVSKQALTYVLSRILIKGLNPAIVQEDTDDVKLLPRTLLPTSVSKASWWTLLGDRFRYSLHINEGESRSQLRWSYIFFSRPNLWNLRWADVSDSSATVGSWAKGRSPKFHLNKLQQRRAVCEGISGAKNASAWIGTEDQQSDWGTREGLSLLLGQPPGLLLIPEPCPAVAVVCWRASSSLKRWMSWANAQLSPHLYLALWEALPVGDNCLITSKGWARLRSWVVTGRLKAICLLLDAAPTGIETADLLLWKERAESLLRQHTTVCQECQSPVTVGALSTNLVDEIQSSVPSLPSVCPLKLPLRSRCGLEHVFHLSQVSTKDCLVDELFVTASSWLCPGWSSANVTLVLAHEVVRQAWCAELPMSCPLPRASALQSEFPLRP